MEDIFVPLWTVQCWVMSHESSLKATTFCHVFMSISHRVSTVPGLKFYHSRGESCRFARECQTKSKRNTLFFIKQYHYHSLWVSYDSCNMNAISCQYQVDRISESCSLLRLGVSRPMWTWLASVFLCWLQLPVPWLQLLRQVFQEAVHSDSRDCNDLSFFSLGQVLSLKLRQGWGKGLPCLCPTICSLSCHGFRLFLWPVAITIDKPFYCWNDSLTLKWLLKKTFWEFSASQGDENVTWSRSGRWLAGKSSGNQQNEWRMQLVHAGLFR